MASSKLSDSEGKKILRTWPQRTSKLWPTALSDTYWMQAHPKPLGSRIPCPKLGAPGADRFCTHPDGMWMYFDQKQRYVDVMAVEVCGSVQNFFDKRSRMYPLGFSAVVSCSRKWLLEEIDVQKAGRQPRWRASGSFKSEPNSDLTLPVRNICLLVSLPNDVYKQFRKECPPGREFYCRHSSLGTFSSQKMQGFLKNMACENHFLTKT